MVTMKNLHNISNKVISLLGVGYYDGKLFRLVCAPDYKLLWQEADEDFRPSILILSRKLYTEYTDSYPLESQLEVNKLIALELQSKSGINQFITYKANDGRIASNKWHFEGVNIGAKVIIPETFLLGSNLAFFKAVEVIGNNSTSYIVNTPRGIISAVKGGLISSLNSFSMASGVSETLGPDFTQVTFNQMAELVGKSLPVLLAKNGKAFYVSQQKGGDFQQLAKPLFITASFVFILYLLLSSVYLEVEAWRVSTKLENGSAEVDEALSVQNEFNKLSAELSRQQLFIDTQSTKTPFWTVLEPLLQEARFRSIRYRNGRFVLNGETEQATRLLELLIANPNVDDAKFDNQIRKSRNSEVFLISFRLKGADNGNI
ncbi:hypothetical protein [Shewanella halifaxensis]|uniref:hypothetical protein n=1 Tax=Shewanella halifaxensis TaxID=271098 RepID=UPI000D58F1F0|nr:hypothetical protein [Shewanella halifaxensis]